MFAAENEKFHICSGEKMKANRNNVKQQNVVVDSYWIRWRPRLRSPLSEIEEKETK